VSDPSAILKTGHRHSSVGMTPAVLSVTLGALGGTRTPSLLIRSTRQAVQSRSDQSATWGAPRRLFTLVRIPGKSSVRVRPNLAPG
jgi:hypothetical protein